MSAPAGAFTGAVRTTADASPRRVQLVSASATVRTALRRALAASEHTLVDRHAGGVPEAEIEAGEAVAAGAGAGAGAYGFVLDLPSGDVDALKTVRRFRTAHPGAIIVLVAPEGSIGVGLLEEGPRSGADGLVVRPTSERPVDHRAAADHIRALLDGDPSAATWPTAATRFGRAADADGSRATASARTAGQATPRSKGVGLSKGAGPPMAPALARPPASASATAPAKPVREGSRRGGRPGFSPSALVVGSSTGGPQALITLFSSLAPQSVRVPILIVQHMPAAFTPILAQHLCRSTPFTAKEATEDEPLTPRRAVPTSSWHALRASAV